MDINFMIASVPLFAKAFGVTLFYGVIGVILSIIVGIVCALIIYFKIPVLKQITAVYIELSRNTPLLVQLFLLYFGLPKIGITLSSGVCAIIGLTFLGGSYMAEAFRSGFESISKTQIESGLSIGLNRGQTLRYVVFPQALSVAMPSLTANVIFLLKETSVFSVVAIPDLMFAAKDLIGIYYKTDEALFMLVLAYLILLLPIALFAAWLERRIRYAEYGD